MVPPAPTTGGDGLVKRSAKLVLGLAVAMLGFMAPLVGSSSAGAATVIHVPADQPTIQGAIDAASNGDTVIVGPGTYAENINFDGKAITVESSQGPSQTTIDGKRQDSVVRFNHGETRASVLEGFTVTNGFAFPGGAFPGGSYEGGGLDIFGASPTIEGNIITENQACADGGGIEVEGGAPLIEKNTVSSNSEGGCSGGFFGAGIAVQFQADGTQLIGNTITDNLSFYGGGIALFGGGAVTVEDNVISDNSAGGDGGGLWIDGNSSALVAQNIVSGNSAIDGGGILWRTGGALTIINNSFWGNTANPRGSVVSAAGGQSGAAFENNIVAGSSSTVPFGCPFPQEGQPTIAYNDLFDADLSTSPTSTCGSLIGVNHNISADPQYVNPSATPPDLHLTPTSPAIDAGTNSAPGLPSLDFDGSPRIDHGVGVVDLGAFEFEAPDTDLTITPPNDISTPATSPAGATVNYPGPTVSDPDDATVPPAICNPASGSDFAIGLTTVTCSVTDTDDTPSTATTTFTVVVEDATSQLSDLAQAVDGVGPGASLVDKVHTAQSSLAATNIGDACSVLTAFTNEVDAQAGKTIPGQQAAQLIANAHRIQSVLAC